jgi:3-methyladenine DNA glycosylase AlkD
MQYNDILKKLETLSNPEAVKGMAMYGITPGRTYSVSIPDLRKIAKETGKNHALAQQLWTSNIRETRILASMIDDPEMVTDEQMDSWVREFDYWEICDQCIMNLFRWTKFAYRKAVEWSSNNEEFVKRAGFVLMACLAVSDKKAGNEQFERFLPIIKREATDNRTCVKKAVSWALRQIGKRNPDLNKKAIETAKEMQQLDSKTAKWNASNALRELTSEVIQKRLQRQKQME